MKKNNFWRALLTSVLLFRIFGPPSMSGAENGGLDPYFVMPGFRDGQVLCYVREPSGSIILGGDFIRALDFPGNRIVRLLEDGYTDASFAADAGDFGEVRAMALQTNGQVVVGGSFVNLNGHGRGSLARLNPDGSLDLSFNPVLNRTGIVDAVAIDPEGRIYVGGTFTSINGQQANRLARLNPDGSLDSAFRIGPGANSRVRAFMLQPDGKLLAAGAFTSMGGFVAKRIVRLLSDGTLDETFRFGTGANETIYCLSSIQSDQGFFIGGDFTSYGGRTVSRIARLNASGQLQRAFKGSANKTVFGIHTWFDRTVIFGAFDRVNDMPVSFAARFLPGGILDQSFSIPLGGPARTGFHDSAGRLVVAGDFTVPTQFGSPGKIVRTKMDVDRIRLRSMEQIEEKRAELIRYVWGSEGWPARTNFNHDHPDIGTSFYSQLQNEQGNLQQIDFHWVDVEPGYRAQVYVFRPIRPNGSLVVHHSGHVTSWFFDDLYYNQSLVIPALIGQGYTVLSVAMPLVHPQEPILVIGKSGETVTLSSHGDIFEHVDRPFRFFLEPIAVALNSLLARSTYSSIYMMGLSGGGWTSTIYPAIDTRIDGSFSVAGSIPLYLRIGFEGLEDAEQSWPEFYNMANYKELYLMASAGPDRVHFQILNRYDNCCFYGMRHTQWVPEVKQAVNSIGAGRYEFFLDQTRNTHTLSRTAFSRILKYMPSDRRQISEVSFPLIHRIPTENYSE